MRGKNSCSPLPQKAGRLCSGNTSPDQKEPTPFIIEWIPDILPQSKIGELRIKFEYGHHRNGHVAEYQDQRPPLDQPLELAPLTTITFP
nr:uncharacterized protein C2orf42-like [Manis javanica]